MELRKQHPSPRFRPLLVGIATLLVVLNCGWTAAGGILRLTTGGNPYPLPNFPVLPAAAVIVIIVVSSIIAGCQLAAVVLKSRVCSLLVGIPFLGLGLLYLLACFMVVVMPGHDDGDSSLVPDAVLPFALAATWLTIGPIMVAEGYWLSRAKG